MTVYLAMILNFHASVNIFSNYVLTYTDTVLLQNLFTVQFCNHPQTVCYCHRDTATLHHWSKRHKKYTLEIFIFVS